MPWLEDLKFPRGYQMGTHKMKNQRLDLLVEFDDRTTVDLEMQLRQTKDNLPIHFSYYLA